MLQTFLYVPFFVNMSFGLLSMYLGVICWVIGICSAFIDTAILFPTMVVLIYTLHLQCMRV